MKNVASAQLLPLVAALTVICSSSAFGQELLVNPQFEDPAEVLDFGWAIEESVTGSPGTVVNSAQTIGFANEPMGTGSELGLWLRAFAGNGGDLEDTNSMINAIATQVVPATPGETYTLIGHSRFEQNYSGGVVTLDPLSPSGAVPSPTQSYFEIDFLDADGNSLGSTQLDLTSENFSGFGWVEHSLFDVAPAGSAEVRVTAAAIDMVANVDPQQSGFYDNFSLTTSSDPTELLTNGDFNAPAVTPGWELIETDGVNTAAFQSATWANNTEGGGTGVWLRSFAEGDATVTQTLSAEPEKDYTLSVYSRWEANYSGGQPETSTETLLEIAFLDESDNIIGDPAILDLTTEQMNDNTWRQHALMATSPAEATSIRVSGIARGMFATEGGQSAFFDDFSLTVAGGALLGDFNGDGLANFGDLSGLVVALTDPDQYAIDFPGVDRVGACDSTGNGTCDFGDLSGLVDAYAGTGASSATAVPEPGTIALLLAASCFPFLRRR